MYPGVPVGVSASVLGTSFYVMEYVAGRIFTDPLLPGLSNAERHQVYESMCRVLALIHNVDISTAQLHDFSSSHSPREYYYYYY